MFLNKKSKGVTLVELLVSLNIIAFGIFIMAIVMIMLLKSGQTSIDNSSAYIVADSVMKKYVSENKGSEESLKAAVESTKKGNLIRGDFAFADKNFKYSIEVHNTDASSMFYIKVIVTEIEADGGSTRKEAIVTTLVSPRTGIN